MIYTNKPDLITTESTSNKTAKTNSIVLKQTERIRTTFEANLVENSKIPENCLCGKLIYERKGKKELNFPTEIISKKNIKIGDILSISLDTTETKKLFDGLKDRYELYPISKIPKGKKQFIEIENDIDSELLSKIDELKSLGKLSNYQIMNIIEHLFKIFKNESELNESSEKFSNIQINMNLTRLKIIKNNFLEFLNLQKNEEEWQNFFSENQWLLSLLFHTPITIYKSKVYLGGKNIDNVGGNIIDFLYNNEITKNVTLIEIKTPNTKLLSNKEYRTNTYSISENLSGGINQLLHYKHSLLKEQNNLLKNSLKAINPFCLLVIGKFSDLENDENKINSFELFRNSLNGLFVITYDELIAKLENLISLLEKI